MKAFATFALLSVLGVGLVYGTAHTAPPPVLLSFQTMYGVDGPFLQNLHHPVRHVRGDELPWELKSAEGSVDTNGHIVIHVRGLVFADDPSVPIQLRGKNDAPEFRALVSCITETSETAIRHVKVLTEGFPANEDGNADIDAQVELPNPCVAPVVFVLPGDEKLWFAVTGFESD